LSAGKTGDDVLLLQEKLQAMGYFPADVEPTGYFGPATKKAVVAFQEENGLPATGFVGPLTRGILQ
jgi:N-acetylmuramoyl-L-alanine amidase